MRLATVLMLLPALLAGCSEEVPVPTADGGLQGMDADNIIFGMASYLTTDGVREARIEADTAYNYVDERKAELLGMKLTFYDEEGRPRATIAGQEGEWNRLTDGMIARGDVLLIVHSDGREIRSEELHYDPSIDQIWSDLPTTQTLADGTVTSGTAFRSDLEFEELRVENVRGGSRPIS